MTKSMASISVFTLAVPLLLAGCGGAHAQPKPPERASQVLLIIEEVLRYEVNQFSPKEGGPEGAVCLGVREASLVADPSPSIMRRLDTPQAMPQSGCKAGKTLIAGPIEWLRDDEVRVKGAYVRASEGEVRLAYRVVRENGRWVCLGPVISWDPL